MTAIERVPSSAIDTNTAFTSRYAKKGEFVTRSIAGETLIVPVRGRVADLDAIYNLGGVASFIWEHIDGRATLKQIVQGVCAEFDIVPEIAEADALQFIADLQRAGLIEPALEARDA